jgi:hypothetical protein
MFSSTSRESTQEKDIQLHLSVTMECPTTGRNASRDLTTEELKAFHRDFSSQLNFFNFNQPNQCTSREILKPRRWHKGFPRHMPEADEALQDFLHLFSVLFVCGVKGVDAPEHVTGTAARLKVLNGGTIKFTIYIAKNKHLTGVEIEYAKRICEKLNSGNPRIY